MTPLLSCYNYLHYNSVPSPSLGWAQVKKREPLQDSKNNQDREFYKTKEMEREVSMGCKPSLELVEILERAGEFAQDSGWGFKPIL